MSTEKDTPVLALDERVAVAEDTGMDPFLIALARQAADKEKAMPLRQAIPIFWRGIFWAGILSVALVMEGFDVVQIGSFYGQPSFQRKFGEPDGKGGYFVSANWQSALGNVGTVGGILGLAANAFAQYRYGSKWVYVIGMIFLAGTTFLPVFAQDFKVLMVHGIFGGFAAGIFQTLTVTYAAELCPLAVRPYLTSWVNICWTLGALLGSATVNACLGLPGDLPWRMPFYLQFIWPVPLTIAAICAPESPWHLARRGKLDEAKKSLSRLVRPGYYSPSDLDAQVALMQHTLILEEKENKKTSIWNCFRGTNLRRTEIISVVFAIQQWCGQPMTSLATQLLQAEGVSVETSFRISLATYGMGLLGTILAWFGMGRFGRRRIYLVGQSIMAVILGVMGILGCFRGISAVSYTTAAMLMFMNFVFQCTVGPACYTYIAELPAADVRAPTVVVSRAAYIISGLITGQLTPRMLSTEEWDWGAKCGFFWMGTNLLGTIYCYFRMPETQGRTFGELDILFANRVPARKFPTTRVEEFEDEVVAPGGDEKAEIEHKE